MFTDILREQVMENSKRRINTVDIFLKKRQLERENGIESNNSTTLQYGRCSTR